MTRFGLSLVALLILATPLFYYITVRFYAEDLAELVSLYGIKNPDLDLERDTVMGLFIQQGGIILLLVGAIFIVMKFVPQRLWASFRRTLGIMRKFRVEEGVVPQLPKSNVSEFEELNATLHNLMTNSVKSYQVQKEFTENASHELQTPLAIAQGSIDNLLQDPQLTEHQAEALQSIAMQLRYMSRLDRNLLTLSRLENSQFSTSDMIWLNQEVERLRPSMEAIAGDVELKISLLEKDQQLRCNQTLFDSVLGNLIINAIRHNAGQSAVTLTLRPDRLFVTNASDEGPLDADHIFQRFYRNQSTQQGTGLGLAIVKSICEYHHWRVEYSYENSRHVFTVYFKNP
jgi:signal transduction histidine kinase